MCACTPHILVQPSRYSVTRLVLSEQKLANAVDSQYHSLYLGTWCIQHYYRWWRTPRLPVVYWPSRRFKWTRPFSRKTKSGFCACAITFQLTSTTITAFRTSVWLSALQNTDAPVSRILKCRNLSCLIRHVVGVRLRARLSIVYGGRRLSNVQGPNYHSCKFTEPCFKPDIK